MHLFLLNLQSNQEIHVNDTEPFVIGRLNVTGCADKKVARNHGKLIRTVDGKILLTALSNNPCFIKKRGGMSVAQLRINEEEILGEGDCFGLLPDTFWFQVTDKEKFSAQSKNNLSQSNNVNESSKEDVQNIDNQLVTKIKKEESDLIDSSTNEATNSVFTPEFEKTRRLPLWRYQIYDYPDIQKEELKKEECEIQSGITFNNANAVPSTSECSDKTKEKKSETDVHQCHTSPAVNASSNDMALLFGCTSLREQPVNGESYSGTGESSRKRPICQYQDNCYRKNIQHKSDFSHPGDEDWIPYEERPMCEFGASCYRKNKSHRVQCRHPTIDLEEEDSVLSDSIIYSSESSPLSVRSNAWHSPMSETSPLPTKRRRKAVQRNSDYGNDDDFDGSEPEDPFEGDASSDEYLPTESDTD